MMSLCTCTISPHASLTSASSLFHVYEPDKVRQNFTVGIYKPYRELDAPGRDCTGCPCTTLKLSTKYQGRCRPGLTSLLRGQSAEEKAIKCEGSLTSQMTNRWHAPCHILLRGERWRENLIAGEEDTPIFPGEIEPGHWKTCLLRPLSFILYQVPM
ncbi:hypothetical protein IW262DRAFT_504552 [Armillaria fumosa]|nr:hypothetical protein IW262DRAFT_504552 [Armillaria fumosa]